MCVSKANGGRRCPCQSKPGYKEARNARVKELRKARKLGLPAPPLTNNRILPEENSTQATHASVKTTSDTSVKATNNTSVKATKNTKAKTTNSTKAKATNSTKTKATKNTKAKTTTTSAQTPNKASSPAPVSDQFTLNNLSALKPHEQKAHYQTILQGLKDGTAYPLMESYNKPRIEQLHTINKISAPTTWKDLDDYDNPKMFKGYTIEGFDSDGRYIRLSVTQEEKNVPPKYIMYSNACNVNTPPNPPTTKVAQTKDKNGQNTAIKNIQNDHQASRIDELGQDTGFDLGDTKELHKFFGKYRAINESYKELSEKLNRPPFASQYFDLGERGYRNNPTKNTETLHFTYSSKYYPDDIYIHRTKQNDGSYEYELEFEEENLYDYYEGYDPDDVE